MHKTRFFSIKMLNTELNQFDGVNENDMSDFEKA